MMGYFSLRRIVQIGSEAYFASYIIGTWGSFCLGIRQPEREAGESPEYSAEVKNTWNYTPTPQYVFTEWCLIK
jgi:hypothetical protein